MDEVKVIDCKDKIISPGFISTHNHIWQTQLKGRHANHTLLKYTPPGNFGCAFYTAEDAFWGELAGALEAIDGGTTTVVDHSHANMSPEFRE
jgi:cytosine/adenosine deaminase-related metal-dependent hydrolase